LNHQRIFVESTMTVSQKALNAARMEIDAIVNKGGFPKNPQKLASFLKDLEILAEAKAWNLPLITYNTTHFWQNARGGGALAKRIGVLVIPVDKKPPAGLPRLSRLSRILQKVFRLL
jgi:hypothetical protein